MPERRRLRAVALLVAALVLVALPRGAAALSDTFVSIGTGDPDGVYYPIGRGLCAMVNAERAGHGLRCSVEATPGSAYNARMLERRELEFAILQADVRHEAFFGLGPFEAAPVLGMRAVLPLHAEIVTLVVAGELPVTDLADLAGLGINVGNPGSGSRASFAAVSAAAGLDAAMFAGLAELRADALPDALCAGRIAGFLETVGHPSGLVRRAVERCGARIAPLAPATIARVTAARPYLRPLAVPGGLYGQPGPVPSVGGQAALMARADVGEDVVHLVASLLLRRFDELRALHPTLAALERGALAGIELSAPLHPGAARAWREAGLIP